MTIITAGTVIAIVLIKAVRIVVLDSAASRLIIVGAHHEKDYLAWFGCYVIEWFADALSQCHAKSKCA